MHPDGANAVLKDKLSDLLKALPDSDLEFAWRSISNIHALTAVALDQKRHLLWLPCE